ncbi:MAG TPA: hypothetical protein VGL05_19355 [Kribbella sp.]
MSGRELIIPLPPGYRAPSLIPARRATTDTRPIDHLDEDWATPCEAGRGSGEAIACRPRNPAAFVVWPVVCCPPNNAVTLWCRPCLDELLSADFLACAHCGHVFDPSSTAIRLIEPLNRRPQ